MLTLKVVAWLRQVYLGCKEKHEKVKENSSQNHREINNTYAINRHR